MVMRTAAIALSLSICVVAEEPALGTRWSVLQPPLRTAGVRDLPPASPLKPLDDFQFTGPMPAHPFVLGNFAADGKFGLVQGGVQLVDGRNAALRLADRADQFELEGRIAMKDYGGWFLLVGWNDETGNGYAVHNVQFKDSGSPWFITEMRGREAVEGTNQELKQFEWKLTQDVQVSVRDKQLTFQVGRTKVLDAEPLENYQPGQVIFGVYDTRYGPRPIRIETLRIRAVESAAGGN